MDNKYKIRKFVEVSKKEYLKDLDKRIKRQESKLLGIKINVGKDIAQINRLILSLEKEVKELT